MKLNKKATAYRFNIYEDGKLALKSVGFKKVCAEYAPVGSVFEDPDMADCVPGELDLWFTLGVGDRAVVYEGVGTYTLEAERVR